MTTVYFTGEARKRRQADEAEAEAAVETPAATVPLAYAGYPFLGGYAYGAYPYAAYGAYPYALAAPAVKVGLF